MTAAPASPSAPEAPATRVIPAPGSDSAAYPPNPGAIVVAIDPGHGGCLDWGVPDPSRRGAAHSEKAMTLAIAEVLRTRLEGEGIVTLLLREGDSALAGDRYPALDCHGPSWRDVNGDGEAGFGPGVDEGTRTRDELQARLDLANLANADLLVSIHINSPSDDGQPIEIAFTESFYTDETPWGATATARLAGLVQGGVVEALDAIAGYERGDRGIRAHNFYIVAPALLEATAERPDWRKQPARGALMPTVLSEVGSITLRAEHDLLVSEAGQEAVAAGLYDGIAAYLADRPLAARIALADRQLAAPDPIEGDGPPFWAPSLAAARLAPLELQLTNTGTEAWPEGLHLVVGWDATDQPYLAGPPDLVPTDADLPSLEPGGSAIVRVTLPPRQAAGRHVAWITLHDGERSFADVGSPPLQVATDR